MLHDPIAPLDVLATNGMFRDPALADLSEAELDDYRRTRDLEAVQARLKGEPTRFIVRRLPPSVIIAMEGMGGAARLFQALLFAVHCVRLPDGAELCPDPKTMKPGPNGTRYAPDEWFDQLATRFGIETCYEVGRVAFEWARLPGAAKGPFSY